MKPGCLSQSFFEFLFYFFRGKSEQAGLGPGHFGMITLHEVVLQLLTASQEPL